MWGSNSYLHSTTVFNAPYLYHIFLAKMSKFFCYLVLLLHFLQTATFVSINKYRMYFRLLAWTVSIDPCQSHESSFLFWQWCSPFHHTYSPWLISLYKLRTTKCKYVEENKKFAELDHMNKVKCVSLFLGAEVLPLYCTFAYEERNCLLLCQCARVPFKTACT